MERQRQVAFALAAIFGLLSALHVVWAFGGRLANGSVIPVVEGKPVFRPSVAITLVVAALRAAAALVVVVRAGVILSCFTPHLATLAAAVLGSILVLRAIGDFRLVGLFKSVRSTAFAQWDSWLYSPLSLALGIATLWLATRPRRS